MHRGTSILFLVVTGSGCEWVNRPCYEIDDVMCRPETEACVAADDETGGEAQCTEFEEPTVTGELISCAGITSEIEVMGDDAAVQYGVTDYAFEAGSTSFAGLFDFQPLPEAFDNSPNPWAGYERSALPGVVTHVSDGLLYAVYFSRVCCPQVVIRGSLDGPPESPTCASSGYELNHVSNAWCLPMDDGAGMCVYPCDVDVDCPEPATEFCDLTVPDPYGNGLGTCRYKSMPTVPTAHEDINP